MNRQAALGDLFIRRKEYWMEHRAELSTAEQLLALIDSFVR